jgi:hypothetical protein
MERRFRDKNEIKHTPKTIVVHQRAQKGHPMKLHKHCLIILAAIYVQGSTFAEQAANPLLLSVVAEKTNILAGGKENATDKTKVTIRLIGSSATSAISATISLEDGLGTQFTDSTLINGEETVEIGGNHPAKISGNGISVVAGQGSALYSITPNVDHVFYLYSSNLVGDKTRVRVNYSSTDKYSPTINFGKPDYTFIYTDWNNNDVPDGTTIIPFQLYKVRAELRFNGEAVVFHRVCLLCESVTDRSENVHALDFDNNKSISSEEMANMQKIVGISPTNSFILAADGVIRRDQFIFKVPYVKTATLRVVDLSICEPKQ